MRGVIAAVLALSLVAGDAMAAQTGALAPGKPASVAGAQLGDNTAFYVIAFSTLLVAGVAFLISTDHSSNTPLTIAGGNPIAVGTSVNSPATTSTQ